MSVEKEINLAEHQNIGNKRYKYGLWEFKLTNVKTDRDGLVTCHIECLGINTELAGGFLKREGYRQFNKQYYRIKDNIVSMSSIDECVSAIQTYTLALPKGTKFVINDEKVNNLPGFHCGREMVVDATQNTVTAKIKSVLSLMLFNPEEAVWLSDTMDKCYLYYENGILEISKSKYKLLPFGSLEGYIWKEQIMKRPFRWTKKRSSVKKFLDIAIGKKDCYMTAIGFMVHTYMDKEGCPILFCIDENLSELNDGGNGKDFFGQIVAQLRKRSIIDGKLMVTNNRFPLETVYADTQIVWFRDIRKNYKMEDMYNFTEGDGLSVRHMNTQPFRVKAKVGVSLQHAIDIEGNSDERRQAFLFFSDEISKRGGVGKAVGERSIFSENWKGSWSAFDSFIVTCIQKYLKVGLVKMDTSKLKQIRADELTNVYEFSKLEFGKFYTFGEAVLLCSGQDIEIDVNSFRVHCVQWCKNLGYKYNREKHKNTRGFSIGNRLSVQVSTRHRRERL